MRWLLIALLVSLAALLIAAAGGAWHIWLQRSKLTKPLAGRQAPGSPPGPAEESEAEEVKTEIL
jgi:uncharacterized membrane protein